MEKKNSSQLNLIEDLETHPFTYGSTIFNKEKIIENLESIHKVDSLHLLKNKIAELKDTVSSPKKDKDGLLNIDSNGDTITVRKDVFISELVQILDTHTIERAKYYIGRLLDGVQKVKTSKINDINLSRWKEYDEIITDSLWVLDKRDNSGSHNAGYWGNLIQQIPNQFLRRCTK